MKNFKVTYLFILSLSFLAISCSDDDSDSAPVVNNVMEIGGQQFDIDAALLESWGENGDGSYDWDVTFTTEGLSFNSETEEYVGTGAVLLLDLNTDSAGGLVPGNYAYSTERAAFKWVFALSGTNVDTADDSAGDLLTYNQGTVTITGTGEDQIITVDILTESGETNTTATYKGSFEFVDYSTTKKNKSKPYYKL